MVQAEAGASRVDVAGSSAWSPRWVICSVRLSEREGAASAMMEKAPTSRKEMARTMAAIFKDVSDPGSCRS